MKKITVTVLFVIFSVSTILASDFDFYARLRKSPLISIDRNEKGKFQHITSITLVNAPVDVVWNAVVEIDKYKSYMPRVLKADIDKVSDDKKTITASFVIKVPLKNTRYTMKNVLEREKNIINVSQVKGDLKDSWFRWKFYPQGDKTLIVYSGRIKNFSKFIESFDDKKEQTISVGINISTILATVKSIKDRSEELYGKSIKKEQETK